VESFTTLASHNNTINIGITRCMPNGTTRKVVACLKWSTSGARWTRGNGCNYEISWTCKPTNFYPTKNCKTSSFHPVTSDASNYQYSATTRGEEATPSMSKKKQATMLRKVRRTIVANARKQAIIRKANGQKPFFVTCDSSRKLKPPY
jgi:hypothetical protein